MASGANSATGAAKHFADAVCELGVTQRGIGEAGVVGQISDGGLRERLTQGAQNRQPAEAGVENHETRHAVLRHGLSPSPGLRGHGAQ